jgi:hypothetical protein
VISEKKAKAQYLRTEIKNSTTLKSSVFDFRSNIFWKTSAQMQKYGKDYPLNFNCFAKKINKMKNKKTTFKSFDERADPG